MSFLSRLLKQSTTTPSVTSPKPSTPHADAAALLVQAREHFRSGDLEDARRCYRSLLETEPNNAQALYMLGGLAINDGDPAAGIQFVRQAIAIDPANADFHFSLGSVFASLGRTTEAIPRFQEALRLRPGAAGWYRQLAAALHAAGRYAEALTAFRSAIRLRPEDPETHSEFANALRQQGKVREAEEAFREAARLNPGAAVSHFNLAIILKDQHRPVEAEAAAREAVKIAPDMPEAWHVLGAVLMAQARHPEAAECFRKALALRPEYDNAWDHLLFAMTYSDHWSSQEVYDAHVQWGRRCAPSVERSLDPAHLQPGHRIRIGYLSPDFRQHSIAYFVEPPLKHHDRGRFEVFCYHTDERADAVTHRLKAHADHWRSVPAPDEETLQRAVREDGIDILVELSGHSEGHRLHALARRLAPIQVTYLGYPNTTGLPAMDYRITDERADPTGESDSMHVEKLIRLPDSFLCYTAPEGLPDVHVPPSRQNGYMTFGSFNNFMKITPATIGLWANVLAAVPGSKLVIKTGALQDARLKSLLLERFRNAGISDDRLMLGAYDSSHLEHMLAYRDVDIALDPFPYHGTTTTLDALWMGVPVISLAGDRHCARVGLSILTCLGLEQLVARSPEEYVQAAARLAADPAGLEELGQTLRARVATSPLTDGLRFTNALERAYLQMWSTLTDVRGAVKGTDVRT